MDMEVKKINKGEEGVKSGGDRKISRDELWAGGERQRKDSIYLLVFFR